MLKSIRSKLLGHESTIVELALDMVNNFQRIKDCYGDASTGTLYFYTIVAFLEKWCGGTFDVETAANMIMSNVTDLANSQDVEVNLRLVSSQHLSRIMDRPPSLS